jgi:RHS repeat-associated protein
LQGGAVSANILSADLDEVFLRTDTSGARSFLVDRLGSTLALADASALVQTQYAYEPFGKPSTSGPSSTNTFEFTGRELDPSGLYYNRARYYDPTLRRFISEDPIGFRGGDLNLYAFVRNNPVNNVDPMGTSAFYIHWLETYEAARAVGFPVWDAFTLGKRVAKVDWGTQGSTAGDANAHAMGGTLGLGGRKQNQCAAYFGTADFVRNADPTHALHAIEDSYIHQYKNWDGGSFWFLHFPGPVHFYRDLWYNGPAEAAATAYLRDLGTGQSSYIAPGCNK